MKVVLRVDSGTVRDMVCRWLLAHGIRPALGILDVKAHKGEFVFTFHTSLNHTPEPLAAVSADDAPATPAPTPTPSSGTASPAEQPGLGPPSPRHRLPGRRL